MSIFIDGHVHIYPEFALDAFFAAAFENFKKAAAETCAEAGHSFVLAMTEDSNSDVFSELQEKALSSSDACLSSLDSDRFCLQKTDEPDSLLIKKSDMTIVLIAGRQLVSKENIELLSLCSRFNVQDRTLPLGDLARRVFENQGVPVLPWGVGKWFGKRGALVHELLGSVPDFPLFAGDNANRPVCWPEPALLKQVRFENIPLMSGSDPLPLASQEKCPGSFGTLLEHVELGRRHPAAALRDLLTTSQGTGLDSKPFGVRSTTVRFIQDQLMLNVRKRFCRRVNSRTTAGNVLD